MIKTFAFLATTIEVAVGTIGMLIEKISILAKGVADFLGILFKGDNTKNAIIEQILDAEAEIKPFKGTSRKGRKQQLQRMSDEELSALAGVENFREIDIEKKDKFRDPNSIGAMYDENLAKFQKYGDGLNKILDGDIGGAIEDLGIKADFLKDIFADTEMPPEVAEEIKKIEQAQAELKAGLEDAKLTDGFTELMVSYLMD